MIEITTFNNSGIVNFNEITAKDNLIPSQKRLFQIIGEPTFGEIDSFALRRSGLSVVSLDIKTIDILEHAINRFHDTEIFPYWHLSSHAKKGQIFLNGFYIDAEWLLKRINFQEVEILFLDACDTVEFADSLTGTIKYVISINSSIESSDAAKIAFDFWSSIYKNFSVEDAFLIAKEKNPKNAPFLYLHF